MPPHWHGCYGCRSLADAGLQLAAYAGEGAAVQGEMRVDPAFEGGPGVIHGGILGSVFDEMMGFGAKMLGLEVVTAHLEVDYARPIPLHSTLQVRAEVQGVLRRKVYVEARARLAGEEKPVGTARALFITIDHAEHFRDLEGNSTRL